MQFDIEAYDGAPFAGAKVALYLGTELAVILRDDLPDLVFANHWDLPGGGREGGETPMACALRECHEELGLSVPTNAVIWGRKFREGTQAKWFFVAQLPASAAAQVVFGDEGQRWMLMSDDMFVTHPDAVPAFRDRLRIWMRDRTASR